MMETFNKGYSAGIHWLHSNLHLYEGNLLDFAVQHPEHSEAKKGFVAGVIAFVCGVALNRQE